MAFQLSSELSWDAKFRALVDNRIFPHVLDRLLLAGKYQSGKTTEPALVFGRDNVEDTIIHRQTIVDDVVGTFQPKPEGGFTWVDGPWSRAMRHGIPLVINEISECSPDVKTALHAFCDRPAAYTLPTGERLKAAPGYGVVATSNFAPDTLPPGVFARFDIIYTVKTLSAGLRSKLGHFAERAEAIECEDTAWLSSWSRPPSVNMFLAAAELQRRGFDDETVAAILGLEGTSQADFLTIAASSH